MAGGLLRIVSEGELQEQEQEEIRLAEQLDQEFPESVVGGLANFVRTTYYEFRRHRSRISFNDRLLRCERSYNGEYSPEKQREIKAFGGSDVFARLVAIKCRGATAMLRDVYLSGDRPWQVVPTPVPELPEDIIQTVDTLVGAEVQGLLQAGQEPDPKAVAERRKQLIKASMDALEKQARAAARMAGKKIEDILVEGGFYSALADFLIDLPIFPIAILKGPIVQMRRVMEWEDGVPEVSDDPVMYWRRVSPFDLYWTPAASTLAEADTIERIRLRHSDLQALIGVPGYDDDAISKALAAYPDGLKDVWDDSETEQAYQENKENPNLNVSRMLDSLEFQGQVPGHLLEDWNNGAAIASIKDFKREHDYNVVCWVVGNFCIKAQIQPNPVQRHNYFGTSFERVAGSLPGHGLPEVLNDVEHVANAAFRSLVNNMSIASGPQVAINEDRMSPTMNTDSLYPWKRWRFTSDPLGNSEKPIDFFQPESNASELMSVFDKMQMLADEVSGIPRYMTGNQNVSGAASTASGLNQLMNNASKVLQQIAAQIDHEVIAPLLKYLHAMVVLTDDTELTWGDINIRPLGVTAAMARDADRQRQLEFLQLTANPLDQNLVGPKGRAVILRELADNLGLDGEKLVPTEDELAQMEQEQAAAMQEQAAQAQGNQAPAPGAADNRPNRGLDNAQRTRTPQAISNQAMP